MNAAFDNIASYYDEEFTFSPIGKKQKQQVYFWLENFLKDKKPLKILEVNCGTGHDANWFIQKNCNVLASDISEKMIEKASSLYNHENLNFIVLDINDLSNTLKNEKFDLIFSNFGGLNCLNHEQLLNFSYTSSNLLNPGGSLVMIYMPKDTLWENLYFSIKLKYKQVFRRRKKVLYPKVGSQKIATYYYNPQNIKKLFFTNFSFQDLKPIGLFIPPSYLNPFFSERPRLLNLLFLIEKIFHNFSIFSRFSDHYLIHFRKK